MPPASAVPEPTWPPFPEAILRDFLTGNAPAIQVAGAIGRAVEPVGGHHRRVHVLDLPPGEDVIVSAAMLLRLCDAALAGALPPSALEILAFVIVASERLHPDPDDERVTRVLFDWMAPEINWELTAENLRMFREWLTGETRLPPEPDLTSDSLSGLGILRRTSKVRAVAPPAAG